ncbi:Uncharacterised protein [uncultured archaeon]|nr:Uncharacterised protein [uncultured archaeon]
MASLNRAGLEVNVFNLQFDKGSKGLSIETGDFGNGSGVSRKRFDFADVDSALSLISIKRDGENAKLGKNQVEDVLGMISPAKVVEAKYSGLNGKPTVEQIILESEELYNNYFD